MAEQEAGRQLRTNPNDCLCDILGICDSNIVGSASAALGSFDMACLAENDVHHPEFDIYVYSQLL